MSQSTRTSNPPRPRNPRRAQMPEARRHSRFLISLPAYCTRLLGGNPAALRGRTADISSGGVAVELPTRLPPGTRVAIEIRTGIGPLRMETDVLWTRRVAGREGVIRHGLCLAGRSELLDLPIHALLGQWLRGLAKRQGSQPAPARSSGDRRVRRETRR